MKCFSLRLLTLVFSIFFIASDIVPQTGLENYTASINGSIIKNKYNSNSNISSGNGKFWCTYDIGDVTDEYRELNNFKLFKDEELLFTLFKTPGSDVEISSSGYVLFYDHSKHFEGELAIHFYSNAGTHLFTKTFFNADQFSFSQSGESFGVMEKENLIVIQLNSGNVTKYEKGNRFDISENDEMVAIANRTGVKIYKSGVLKKNLPLKFDYLRKIKISAANDFIALINKKELLVYRISDGSKLFSEGLSKDLSFRDISIVDNKIIAGVHKKNNNESSGSLRVYDLGGNLVNEKTGESKLLKKNQKINLEKKTGANIDPIPWPFAPFDSMRTVWNHYEQHMGNGGGDWSYLHQGLDLITPIGEETYSVTEGIVKLMLTIGGASYWRIAVSDTMVSGYSDGWLYAHLIENTIQFDVGDTVQVHDYLGDIIQWSSDWGHIHFVEIRDSGLVWFYDDNEWGINFNPLLALQPLPDTTSPSIEPVFEYSKFGFCENETSNYLTPDSLYGDIDIIAKTVDYAGDSEWQQPAFRTYYWITDLATGDTIQSRKMGHILNHSYPFYEGSQYTPFAEVMYKRDEVLPASSWNDTLRNYYHNLTNSNGDSLLDLNERLLAFNTANYFDGYYRIFVEVFDETGNSDLDSMDVQFKNGNPNNVDNKPVVKEYTLYQNYPNPFNPATTIKFTISDLRFTTLKVYDVLGNEVATLIDEEKPAGEYNVEFRIENVELSSGVYFFQWRTGEFVEAKKMILLK